MKECCVCMNAYKNGVKCFGVCRLEICLSCFNNILKINRVDDIEYCCPQCRHTSIKNLDLRFTKYLNNNKKIMKRIISLLEQHIEAESKRMLSHNWETFTARVEILTPQELAELTY